MDRWTGDISVRANVLNNGIPFFSTELNTPIQFKCDLGWGVGIFDMAHFFADIDGDGRADYLCMEKNGKTYAILNTETFPRDLGQIKFSVDKDRANHRFADVNGDGKADFLWIDKFTGDVEVWYNQGVRDSRPADGSMVQWDPKGKLYNGVDRGANEYFPDLDGDGRADILRVTPNTNWAEVWYNKCPSGTGGDDANSDPNLPKYPPDPPELTCPADSRPCRENPLLCPDNLEDDYDAPLGDGPSPPSKRRRGVLEPRVDKDPKFWLVLGGLQAILRYAPYPSGMTNYFNLWQPFTGPRLLLRYIVYDWGSCNVGGGNTTIETRDVETDANGRPIPPDSGGNNNVELHSDHIWDVSKRSAVFIWDSC